MNFPTIERIEDVLPHIEGKSEFVVAERDGFAVINYMVAFDTTFPELPEEPTKMGVTIQNEYERECEHALMLRECRGLMFDREGKLISRPFNKFFNVNERPSTQAKDIDLTQGDFVLLEKLDGSFIRPVRIDGIIRLCTKMGITEQSHQAEDFLEALEDDELHNDYFRFFEDYVDDFTPIFEFCSRKNQIVIDYPEDKLVLLAMRHNQTGKYIRYSLLKKIAKVFNIPVVQPLFEADDCNQDFPVRMEDIVDRIRHLIGVEGGVLRFNDGRAYKIKAEDYCVKHGAKDGLLLEKNVLATFLNEKLDDVLPLLDEAFRNRVDEYTETVSQGIHLTVVDTEMVVHYIKKHYETRKEQALFIKDSIRPFSQSLMFAALDGKDIRQTVIQKLLSHTDTQTRVDSIREYIGNPSWA
jgi:RNA ligase